MENRFSFLTKEKGQWCALRYYGTRKCISYSATDQDKNHDKFAQRQKCFKRSQYFYSNKILITSLERFKIFLITFKLLMKLFSRKIYYTQDDDSLFSTITNESDSSAYTFYFKSISGQKNGTTWLPLKMSLFTSTNNKRYFNQQYYITYSRPITYPLRILICSKLVVNF